jgi:hypothetical protein
MKLAAELRAATGGAASVEARCEARLMDARAIHGRGLHSLTSELNLRTFGNTSLTLELNLSIFGTHPRVTLGYMGDTVSLS